MADVGFIALILALITSIYSVIAFVLGAVKGYTRLTASARKGVLIVCVLVSLAAYALYYALLTHDFQIDYVASYTSLDTPLIYTISAFWAGNAGSLLFMTWFLSLASVVAILRLGRDRKFTAYTAAIVIGTVAFFQILMVFIENPFERLHSAPLDGRGLDPVLQNLGMVIHPPLLLIGYIAFTVPFALAIAALITKRRGSNWLLSARTWALIAWLFLGVGNLIGAWWAYVELGWGGYWNWDPVENAGLMPWLVVTAFLHSITIQQRMGMLKVWTIVLVILSFNLCIFGMFLNRSDFLSSVHNYTNTGMETLFLAFLAITLIGPLGLVLSRRSYLRGERREGPLISKENSFVLTNILFTVATLVIFLGTMFPWLSEKITGSITTLESSFFDKAVGPIFLLIILLAGICILLGWRRTSFFKFVRKVTYPLLISLGLCLVLCLVGITEWYAIILYPLCCFVIMTHLFRLFGDVRARISITGINPFKVLAGLLWAKKPHYGGIVIHLGIALIAIGIIGSSFYQSEGEAALLPGDSMTIENYTLTYEELTLSETSTRDIFKAKFSVNNGDSPVGVLEPEYIIDYRWIDDKWLVRDASEVTIRSMPHWWLPQEDLYVALGLNKILIFAGWTKSDPLPVKVLVNPLVNLIWIGGGVLTLGGLFTFLPYRSRKDSGSEDKHQTEEPIPKVETGTMSDTTSSPPPASMSEAA